MTGLGLGAIGGIVLSAIALAAYGILPMPSLPRSGGVAPATATAQPLANTGSLSGFVWSDICSEAAGPEASTPAPGGGCRTWPDGLVAGDGTRQVGEPGIGGVVIQWGAGACPASKIGRTFSDAAGRFALTDLSPGPYCIVIMANDSANQTSLGAGQWTVPRAGSNLASMTVELSAGQALDGVDFGWTRLNPRLADTPTPTPSPSATVAPCSNVATFVKDVQTPANSSMAPGQAFARIWRITNTGTCTWSQSYALVFDSGAQLGGESPKHLIAPVEPGQSVDLRLDLTAPNTTGAYTGYWLLETAQSIRFGLTGASEPRLSVKIVVGSGAQPVNGGWKGEYFANRDLRGSPKLTRTDPLVSFDWGGGSPGNGIPEDDFSARWTGKASFDSGPYLFKLTVDDGARLYVDGQLVLDAWKTGGVHDLSVIVGLAKGTHTIVLEYFEHTHDAVVRLGWEKAGSVTISHWKGEYWSNESLSGTPSLVRDDEDIDFRWGSQAPTGLPADRFSARWTRTIDFKSGDYLFSVKADDGIRVYVDNKRVLDQWHGVDETTLYTFTRHLSGKHTLKVEYYEHTGDARAYLAWEQQVAPTATPTATSTPTDTTVPPTNTLEPTATDTPTP
jgi:hypothetical protein